MTILHSTDPPARSAALEFAASGAPPIGQKWLLGALCIVAAELMFVLMGVGIRMVAQELPSAEIVFFRNFIGLVLLLPLLARHRGTNLLTRVPHLHLLRGLAGLSAMYCFFYAIAHIPLAEAMLLKLTSPLFIPLVALLWLGEAVPWRVRWALLIGFAGVALILRPDFGQVSPVASVALLGGLFAALAKVTVRRLSRTEPTTRIVFYFALVGVLVSSAPLFWYWQTPSARALGWLLALGLCATLGQLLLTRGLSLAPAARMGAFGFFSVVFAALVGWILWEEVLTWAMLAGSVLVVLAGLAAGSGRPASTSDLGRA
jgi:drug/metabolite transporter (DMT)-like permease